MNAACAQLLDRAGALSIRTDRLRLRPVAESDATATSRLINPAIARNLCTWPPVMTAEQVRARIREYSQGFEAGTRLDLALLRRSDGELLGWLGFESSREREREANVGFWLGVEHQGRGFMPEAIRAALATALAHLRAESFAAEVFADNAPSIAMVRGLGMELAGAGEALSKGRDGPSPTLLFRRAR